MSGDGLRAAVRLIVSSWPGEMDRERVAAYVEGLGDVPPGELVAAVRDAVRVEDRRPSVAALRRRVLAGRGLLGPDPVEAVAQVEALNRWRRRCRVAPGAGPVPVRPDVHPLVEAAWAAAGPDAPTGVFTARYRTERDLAAETLAAARLDEAGPALSAPTVGEIG